MILFILLSESERSAHRLRHGAEEGPGGHPQDLIQVGQVYQKRITLSLIKFSIPVLCPGAYRQFIMTDYLPLNETF